MCFDFDYLPTLFKEYWPIAKKEYKCCECNLTIHKGEQHHKVFGVWDGEPETYRTCSFCEWMRNRIRDEEFEHGCLHHEAQPGFSGLYEALHDGYYETIGIIRLETE